MSATKRQASQRVSAEVPIDRLRRALAQLQETIESQDLRSLDVRLKAFVRALRDVSGGGDELRRCGTFVKTRCSPATPFSECRGKAVGLIEMSWAMGAIPEVSLLGHLGIHPTLRGILSPSLKAPDWPEDLATVKNQLNAVLSWGSLPAIVVEALQDWRDVCVGILDECDLLQAEGCYWLLKACPESTDRESVQDAREAIAWLRSEKLTGRLRKAVIAAESLVTYVTSSMAAGPDAPLVVQHVDDRSKDVAGQQAPKGKPKLSTKAEAAYQSYEMAVRALAQNDDDKRPTLAQAYEWLKENGPSDYELPRERETWKRYVREGRNHYGTQQNRPRAGRTSRSIVPAEFSDPGPRDEADF
jgi:hypothetical protein